MKICKNCGKEIDDRDTVCVGCGNLCDANNRQATSGEVIIAALFPIIGAILYYFYKRNCPNVAKTMNTVSVTSFIVYIVLYIMIASLSTLL